MGILNQAESGEPVAELCREHSQILQMACGVWQHGRVAYLANESVGRREKAPQEDVCREEHAERFAQGGAWKKW